MKSEAQSKWERGLCYHCDEKWAPGRRCKQQELQTLGLMAGEEGEDDYEPKMEGEVAVGDPGQERASELRYLCTRWRY